jgi:hypothetical protein
MNNATQFLVLSAYFIGMISIYGSFDAWYQFSLQFMHALDSSTPHGLIRPSSTDAQSIRIKQSGLQTIQTTIQLADHQGSRCDNYYGDDPNLKCWVSAPMWQLILQMWPRYHVTGIASGLLCDGTYIQNLHTSHQDSSSTLRFLYELFIFFISTTSDTRMQLISRALKLYRWSASLHHHFHFSSHQPAPICVICLFNWSTWPSVDIELASSLVDVTVSDQCVTNDITLWHVPNLRKLCLSW